MLPAVASIAETEINQFQQACLRAIIRAEAQGRVPVRFMDAGQAVWKIFHNELTVADLVALAIEDSGVTMPIPFAPARWWPDWPDWALLHQSPSKAEQWIAEAISYVGEPQEAYLRRQAALLELALPADETIANLPSPSPHDRWLELPGTGGWIAYTLAVRPGSNLYLWENFRILCATFQEMLLAGLIAWELGAPPRTELPIQREDASLTATLKSGETYSAVVGRRDLHGHRNLSVLHQRGEQPLWI